MLSSFGTAPGAFDDGPPNGPWSTRPTKCTKGGDHVQGSGGGLKEATASPAGRGAAETCRDEVPERQYGNRFLLATMRDPINHFLGGWAECGNRGKIPNKAAYCTLMG